MALLKSLLFGYEQWTLEEKDQKVRWGESPSERPGGSRDYETRELSEETWPDFAELFSRRGMVGDGWWCWCTFHHVTSYSDPQNAQPRTRAEKARKNMRMKEDLVKRDCAHGILVYADGHPVGWCQYGLKNELPRVDHSRSYQSLKPKDTAEKIWRITCFVVDGQYRGKGVARTGLRAALDAIRKRGGGMVEAYPVSKSDQGSNYLYSGTVSMFEKEGFKPVAPLGTGRTSTVVVRKTV